MRDIYRLIASLRLAQFRMVKFLRDIFLADDSIFLCGERYALYLETEVIEFNFSNCIYIIFFNTFGSCNFMDILKQRIASFALEFLKSFSLGFFVINRRMRIWIVCFQILYFVPLIMFIIRDILTIKKCSIVIM